MAICCNPGHPDFLCNPDIFSQRLIARIEHKGGALMRVYAGVIQANSNFDDIAGFIIEEKNEDALRCYGNAFKGYRSAKSELEERLSGMPDMAAEFVKQANKARGAIEKLGLDWEALDYKTFFARRFLEQQTLLQRLNTVLGIQSQGKALIERGDLAALLDLMVESVRALTEVACTNLTAGVTASRQAGLCSQLIARELLEGPGRGKGKGRF
ncbi:MAG: hypothetical protein V3U86_00525 [Acidobacteriota bacterium]